MMRRAKRRKRKNMILKKKLRNKKLMTMDTNKIDSRNPKRENSLSKPTESSIPIPAR